MLFFAIAYFHYLLLSVEREADFRQTIKSLLTVNSMLIDTIITSERLEKTRKNTGENLTAEMNFGNQC